ncbi:unnamed protein product [Diamesa serratosioi]
MTLIQMSLAIDVKYEHVTNTATPGYFCITIGLVITQPGEKITSFNGVHQQGMTDNDVHEFNTTKQNTDYLPHGLAEKFVNLETLYVIQSGLKAIARNDFETLTKLKEIAFYGNEINEIPAHCFDDLLNLKKLSLSNNRIKYLPNEVFHHLPNLNDVYISNNKLEALPSNLFANNPQINIINFRSNSLKSIGEGIIIKLKELKSVNLKENTCINDNFPSSSLETLSKKIKEQCSVEDLCLHTRIEVNSEVQELNRKLDNCENEKLALEKLQLSFMHSISKYEKGKFEDEKKLDFWKGENLYLRVENEQLKKNDELEDLKKVIGSLKEDIIALENSSNENESTLEEQIGSLLTENSSLKDSELKLKSQTEELKKQIQILKTETAVERPTSSASNGIDPKKMELAYKVLMFAVEKFKENDQNKPIGAMNADKKKSQIEFTFHHNG